MAAITQFQSMTCVFLHFLNQLIIFFRCLAKLISHATSLFRSDQKSIREQQFDLYQMGEVFKDTCFQLSPKNFTPVYICTYKNNKCTDTPGVGIVMLGYSMELLHRWPPLWTFLGPIGPHTYIMHQLNLIYPFFRAISATTKKDFLYHI